MEKQTNTLLGFAAILLWSTAAAFTRTLSEDLGAFTAASLVHLLSGILAVGYQWRKDKRKDNLKNVPRAYWLTCGFFYMLYVSSSYLSVGVAESREQVIVIILIKFLWPLFTMLLTIPILKTKTTLWIIPGVLLSLSGITLATLGTKITDFATFGRNLSGNYLPYLLGFVAAFAWAFYSNFSRKLVGDSEGSVGYFILATGIVLGVLGFNFPEPQAFSGGVFGQLLYQVIFTSFIATLMWDAAMRKGNIILVTIMSNFLPLLTVVISSLLLGVRMGGNIWISASLVVAGTWISRRSFQTNDDGSYVIGEAIQ